MHSKSAYFRAMEPGLLAFKKYPVFGIGPGNLRILCPELTGGSPAYDCHPHPHNFYIQLLGEVGLLGFLAGVLLIGSIIWTCARPAFIHRSNVVVATMWIVPFALGRLPPRLTSLASGAISLCGVVLLLRLRVRDLKCSGEYFQLQIIGQLRPLNCDILASKKICRVSLLIAGTKQRSLFRRLAISSIEIDESLCINASIAAPSAMSPAQVVDQP